MKSKAVSIIIPTYNCATHLPDAINSVLDQDIGGCEILVVDDGSTDNTKGVLSEFENHPEVIVLRHPDGKNHGTCASRKLAIKNASGRFLAFLDADDYFLPGKLKRHIAILESHPEVALVHSPVVVEKLAGAPERTIKSGCPLDGRFGIYNPVRNIDSIRRNIRFNSTVVCRSSAIELNDLPDSMVFQLEDRLLWINMAARNGLMFYADSEPLTCYRVHQVQFTSQRHQNPAVGALSKLEFLCALASRKHNRIKTKWLVFLIVDELFKLIESYENMLKNENQPKIHYWRSRMSIQFALVSLMRIPRGIWNYFFQKDYD